MSTSDTEAPYTRSRSDDVKINLTRLGVTLGVLAALVALAGAWFILPYRMDAAEKKIAAHEAELGAMKEILIRIDENVKDMRRSDRRNP